MEKGRTFPTFWSPILKSRGYFGRSLGTVFQIFTSETKEFYAKILKFAPPGNEKHRRYEVSDTPGW